MTKKERQIVFDKYGGNCAKEFLKTKNINKPIEYTIHPSKRNSFLYNKNRENVLIKLRKITKF